MLTHLDEVDRPAMVDVSGKTPTKRTARARAEVSLPLEVRALFRDGELHSKKGPVFHTAVLTGTMAAKKTSDLLPLCHPLPLEKCTFDVRLDEAAGRVVIECEVATHHRTGVEMEALAGVYAAALAIYDMCKGISHDIVIHETRLLQKAGGKRDFHHGDDAQAAAPGPPPAAPPLYGLVLAGGESRRMGRPKWALDYAGEPHAHRTARLLAPVCERVFLSVRPGQDDRRLPDVPAIADVFPAWGPAAGILSAMEAHPGAAWLVAACDLPFLDTPTLAALVAARDPLRVATAYRSAHDGLPEPLCAVWEPHARRQLLQAAALGRTCPRKVLIESRPRLLDLVAPHALENANTPAEYEAARTALRPPAHP